MGARCTEQDHRLKASTTFRSIHCVGCWIQRNILGLDHTTFFNRLMLHIIHYLMTKQHTVCINTIIFNRLITNSTQTRGVKYSHPVLVTYLCKNFLPDDVFDSYDHVFIAQEQATGTYNSCLYAVCTPSHQLVDAQAESSFEELLEEDYEPAFWQQPPLTNSRAFMSSLRKGMKKTFKGQIRLRKQMEEQTTRLEYIEEGLRRLQSASLSTSASPSRRRG